jgi:hypothetical protein
MSTNKSSIDPNASGPSITETSASFVPDGRKVKTFLNSMYEARRQFGMYSKLAKSQSGFDTKIRTSAATAYYLRQELEAYTANKPFDKSSLIPTNGGTTAKQLTESRNTALENAEGCMTLDKHTEGPLDEQGVSRHWLNAEAYYARADGLENLRREALRKEASTGKSG